MAGRAELATAGQPVYDSAQWQSVKDVHAGRADQEPDDDEHDSPEDLAAKQREHPGEHQDDREEPQNHVHTGAYPARCRAIPRTLPLGSQLQGILTDG